MSVGEVASLIAALAFLLLVVFLAIPLWKLGKVFDQLQGSIKQVAADTGDTVKEVSQTVRDANAQLVRVDAVTTSAAQVAQDISAVSTLVSSTFAGPLIKLSAFSYAARRMFKIGRASCRERVCLYV